LQFGLCFCFSLITNYTVGKSIAKPNATEILGFILLICSALLVKNLIGAIDYIAWGTIGILTIYLSRSFAYSKYTNKKHKIIFLL